jgi:glycerophosphoryl diester phosphodiesterase
VALAAISGHQGGADHRLPVGYESFRAVAGSGAEYVELDVRRTRDGVLVAHHDERLGGDGAAAVADLEYGELCERLGRTVPRVADVMGILAGKAAGHLDLKETGYEDEVVELALEAFGPDGFVVTTLEDASVARISREFPLVRTALSLGRDLDGRSPYGRVAARLSEVFPVRRLNACGAQWAALDYRLAWAGVLGRCAAGGIGTMLWTVDRDTLITRFLKDPRVDVVITNRPERARALRDALEDD